MALAEFDRFFKKFPPEVKEMIWDCAATSSPRTVTIKLDENKEIVVANTIPALLHTNKHARAVALKKYTLMFANQPATGPFYINLRTDTIYAEGFGALAILTEFPYKVETGGARHFIQGALQNMMVSGDIQSLEGPEFKLLQNFTALRVLKLEIQAAALESGPAADMGGSWHKILVKRLRKENKGLIVKWYKKVEMEEEVAQERS